MSVAPGVRPDSEVRDRLTDRVNRERLRLEFSRGLRPAVVVVLGLAIGLAIAGYIAAHVSSTLFSSTHEVSFAVDDVTGVVVGADQVRFKGIPAGTITGLKFVGGTPVITATINDSYGTIYRNATAELRPNTALEDMYLDITNRGTAAAGVARAGAALASTQTDTSVNIDDVLDVFQAPVRAQLHTLIDQLGNGLADRGAQLRTAFEEFVPFLTNVGDISQQLAMRRPLVAQLVHNTALLTQMLGSRQQQLNTLVQSGSQALSTLAADRGNLAATLNELPPTLSAVNASFTSVLGVLGDVDNAVTSLEPVASYLPTALTALKTLNSHAAPAVRALQSPVKNLVPLSDALQPLSQNLSAAVTALQPQIPTVNKVTSDLVACQQGIVDFFQWNSSISKFGDDRGPIPRGNVVAGAGSSGLVSGPDEFAPADCAPGQPITGRPAVPGDGH